MSKQIIFFGSVLFLTSCGGWSDTDKSNFLDRCDKAKFNYDYCECVLEKAMKNYTSLDDITENEIEFGELAIECIEKDRVEVQVEPIE